MAEIGMSLDRLNVIEFVNDLIKNTDFENKLRTYKFECKLPLPNGANLVDLSWYRKFMKRHQSVLRRGQCHPRDINRYSWCTYENFSMMYKGVSASMVQAGIAVELEETIMYSKNGEIANDSNQMYGRPTKYKITRPEYLLFVDETGCNTNMKDDGFAGGQLFVLLVKMGAQLVRKGATTNIHFTVLCFQSATGEPVLCKIILKSAKLISDIPLSWKMGIDIQKDIHTGDTRFQTFEANYGEGRACTGGPKCQYNSKETPLFGRGFTKSVNHFGNVS
jgi:hypothetical protein